MRRQINRLLNFALRRGLATSRDLPYCGNRLLALLGEDSFALDLPEEDPPSPAPILEAILDLAVGRSLIEDTPDNRDRLDSALMDCLMPRPSEVAREFWRRYALSPEAATGYFYDLSVNCNYVRKTRTDLNIIWPYESPFGRLEITINVSKPEKDPRDIARALSAPESGYPACLLCLENEGFQGTSTRPARQNLRLVPLPERLSKGIDGTGGEWLMQYSPYIYYNEHSIFLSSDHRPMRIDLETLVRLLDIIDLLPSYFVGSNADLPIVGGSILNHDHYQGGRHVMPVEGALVERAFEPRGFADVTVGRLNWPLSTLRLGGPDKGALARLAALILQRWRGYSDPSLGILAETDGAPHNTVTPVARRRGALYELDLILRNNRTTPERPFGLFHPREDVHHIKRENIGLIEAMGLAILPARLQGELAVIEDALAAGGDSLGPGMALHEDWYQELKGQVRPGVVLRRLLRDGVGAKFLRCLLDAGVFKRDEEGLAGFDRFAEGVFGRP